MSLLLADCVAKRISGVRLRSQWVSDAARRPKLIPTFASRSTRDSINGSTSLDPTSDRVLQHNRPEAELPAGVDFGR
jgi:hypothetical protein